MDDFIFRKDGYVLTLTNNTTVTYRICTRKESKGNKSTTFLIQKTPKERYVSSLYQLKPNVYKFESGGKHYNLIIGDDKAIITGWGQNADV